MNVEIGWRSRQGQRTDDNRDCGAVGLRPDAVLAIVLDGSTAGPQSGALARHIAHDLVDWFVGSDATVTAQEIIGRLRHIHSSLPPDFRADSASYVIALVEMDKPILVLHAGDCLAGAWDGRDPVSWLIRPHTLANAIDEMSIPEIAASPVRNRITRSFRAREFIAPDISEISMEGGGPLVLATDGFWAALDPKEQVQFLAGEKLAVKNDGDDCSVLGLRVVAGEGGSEISGETAENFYVAEQAGLSYKSSACEPNDDE